MVSGSALGDLARYSENLPALREGIVIGSELLAFKQSPTHQKQTGNHHRDAPVSGKQILIVEGTEDP